MDCKKGYMIDHINGDLLDARKSNLRVCTSQQNAFNRKPNSNKKSKFKGVSLKKGGVKKPWYGRITVNGKKIDLGYYATEKEAALAYDKAALEYFGEFAWRNFQ